MNRSDTECDQNKWSRHKDNLIIENSLIKDLVRFSHVRTGTVKNSQHDKIVSLWRMGKIETIEEFYQRKFDWMPDNIRNEIGHFNVFKLDPFVGDKAKPVPYKRRDFFKIMLVIGNSKVHYADKVFEVDKQALSFSNPLQEAKILLEHSTWSVSNIAYALGFTEVTHFNNFFKKHIQFSPLKFRNA